MKRLLPLLLIAVALQTIGLTGAQGPQSAPTGAPASSGISTVATGVTDCRKKIYAAIGPARLISPEGIRVTVPMQDAAAARARGFKIDLAALKEEAQEYGKGQKQSEEQAILAKLSDEQLDALFSEVAACTFKYSESLSRDDLVYYGIAMGEIASAKQFRAMGHLLVTTDEERVKQYNALVAKYNALLGQCH